MDIGRTTYNFAVGSLQQGGSRQSSISPFVALCLSIKDLNYASRKLLLEAARIQHSFDINRALASQLQKVVADTPFQCVHPLVAHHLRVNAPCFVADVGTRMPTHTIISLFNNFYDNVVLCSYLAYLVRAETTTHLEEFLAQLDIGREKELQASQSQDREQQLDYRAFALGERVPVHVELNTLCPRSSKMFIQGVQKVADYFQSIRQPLLPFYNKKKNVGYATQINYLQRKYGEELSRHAEDVTSLHLLRLYSETGITIEGPMEMRTSWKYSILKPRVYYALGGTDYFRAIYIKQIALKMITVLPSCHPFTRFSIDRLSPVSDDKILITYDYSSFTTNIAEVKYFMWYLGHLFEGVHIPVLDLHTGVQEIDLGKYLHEYNEAVNINQVIDTNRLWNRSGESSCIWQQRNGSLGVGGNISFSGLTHALSLAGFNDQADKDSVVGDDALTDVHTLLIEALFVVINKLGLINREKITEIAAPKHQRQVYEDAFKYLKRPLARELDGTILDGILETFPGLQDFLCPEGDGIHTVYPSDARTTIKSLAAQTGVFFHRIQCQHNGYEVELDDDLEFVMSSLRLCYEKYGLPIRGSIPDDENYFLTSEGDCVYGLFYIPPLDTSDVFNRHWMDVLYDRFGGRVITVPVSVIGEIPLPVDAEAFTCCQVTVSTPFTTLLVDMGCIRKNMITQSVPFTKEVLEKEKDRINGLVRDEYTLYNIEFIYVPDWYRSYLSYGVNHYDPQIDLMTYDYELSTVGYLD